MSQADGPATLGEAIDQDPDGFAEALARGIERGMAPLVEEGTRLLAAALEFVSLHLPSEGSEGSLQPGGGLGPAGEPVALLNRGGEPLDLPEQGSVSSLGGARDSFFEPAPIDVAHDVSSSSSSEVVGPRPFDGEGKPSAGGVA